MSGPEKPIRVPSSDPIDRLVNVAKFLYDFGSDSGKAHGTGTDFKIVSRGLYSPPPVTLEGR